MSSADVIQAVVAEVDALRPLLINLSHRIHAHPELGFEERRACAWCVQLLRERGFEVTSPVAGLETAFRATRGAGRPVVAFLAEYDALPGVGHACGHNVIAAAALGAGLALAGALSGRKGEGTVIVDGTPGEETNGGKIPMVAEGLYRDVDVVLSMHPDVRNLVGGTCLAVKGLIFSFRGRSAHAASEPEKGVNALDAVIQTFNNINALRQHLKPDVRIHGIVTHGGKASNVVPDFAQADFSVRSADMVYFQEVLERVRACARAAALATGAGLEITEEPTFEPIRDNRTLTRLLLEAMKELGLPAEDGTGRCQPASTDFGNVSQVVPAGVASIRIAPPGTTCHHPDFAAAAASPEGDAAILSGAKVLAMVGARLVTSPVLLEEAKADFRAS